MDEDLNLESWSSDMFNETHESASIECKRCDDADLGDASKMADRSMSIMSEKTDDLDLQSPPMFHSELFVEWFFQINTYISPENRTDGDNSNKRTATGNS